MLPVYGQAPEPTEEEPNPQPPIIDEEPNPDCLIPADAVEITDAQWQELLAHPGLRRWLDGEVVAYEPPPPAPTEAMVVVERERRLAAGFDYDFDDDRGIHRIGTTEQDMAGWREVTDLANALLAVGDTTTAIQIVTDTGPVSVTAPEWTAILIAAAAFRQPLWAASFALQAGNPIPADFTDDAYWTGL